MEKRGIGGLGPLDFHDESFKGGRGFFAPKAALLLCFLLFLFGESKNTSNAVEFEKNCLEVVKKLTKLKDIISQAK